MCPHRNARLRLASGFTCMPSMSVLLRLLILLCIVQCNFYNLVQARGGVDHPSITKTRTLGPDSSYTISQPAVAAFDEQVFLRPKLFPSPSLVVLLHNDTLALGSSECNDLLLWHSVRGPGYGSTVTDQGGDTVRARRKGFYVSSVSPAVNYLTSSVASQIMIGGKLWTRDQIKHYGLTSGLIIKFTGDSRFDFRTVSVEDHLQLLRSQARGFKDQQLMTVEGELRSEACGYAEDEGDVEYMYLVQSNERAMRASALATSSGTEPKSATYAFTLPSACVMSRYPPPSGAVTFTIAVDNREVLGQVMSFFIMISAVLCALSTLAGSLIPLLLLQAFAALTMVSCAPPSLLAETFFTHYVLFPSRTFILDFSLSESTLIVIGGVAGGIILLELIHYAFERKSNLEERYVTSERRMAEAAEVAMRDAAKRGVRLRSTVGGSEAEEDDDGLFTMKTARLNKRRSEGRDDYNDLSAEDESNASGAFGRNQAASVVEETLQSVRDTAVAAAGEVRIYLPMFPYLGTCVLCGICVGAILHSSTIVFGGGDDVMLGVSVIGLLVFGVGMPMFALGVSMQKNFVYCHYRMAQGGLPPSMHVSGVWGPNNLRLRFGIFCEDFRESRRSTSVVALLYALTLALLSGSSPSTRGGCTTVFGVAAVLTFSFGLLTFVVWPLRSRLNNACLLAVNVSTFMYECCMLAFVSDASDTTSPTAPSVHGALVCGSLVCVASIVASVSRLITSFWEIKGSRAAKYASLYHAEDALDAEMTKLQTELEVEAGVEEALEMYRIAAREAAEDDENLEREGGIGNNTGGGGGGGLTAGTKRRRLLQKARDEALEKARWERITGMRYAHDTVRPGASLAIGDDRHPSYADFLLVDYHMVPEETRHEFRMMAQVRNAAQRGEATANALATLTFEEQMILQGRSQHSLAKVRSSTSADLHTTSISGLRNSESVCVPHIHSSSVLPTLTPAQAKRIAEEQRRRELIEQKKSLGIKLDEYDDDL